MAQFHLNLQKLPGVDILLNNEQIKLLLKNNKRELVVYSIRQAISFAREQFKKGKADIGKQQIIDEVKKNIKKVKGETLKPVINATGIVLHTNLGRAPLGEKIFNDISEIIKGYSNLEFNLELGKRGKRDDLISPLINYLTGAENSIVVNNNAAAIMFILSVFAKRKEVIISRGELIEIGGSFRIPDILKASGAKMIEVGTTNKTHLSDYQNAISSKTAMIFKAHKSNFDITGFTKEVCVKELTQLAQNKGLIFMYDIGSGLLRKPKSMDLDDEPDVKSAIKDGADLVTFSGDKLLGGPQSGIISGRQDLISTLSKAPMMRALRVGKLTIAALLSACRNYLSDDLLKESSPLFAMLERDEKDIKKTAEKLLEKLKQKNVSAEIIENIGQCGSGTLPNKKIKSYAVILKFDGFKRKQSEQLAEKIYKTLLFCDKPIISILRCGKNIFDVLTLFDKDLSYIANTISNIVSKEMEAVS